MNDRLEIPASWLGLTLGDVIDYGKTVKSEPSEIPADAWVLELEDIEKDTSQLLQRLTFAHRLSKSTKNRFAAGDVLYGKLRPYLNKILIADQDGYCTTEIIPIKPNIAIDGRYLFYWFKHPEFLGYVGSVSHGIQMPRLGTEAGLKAPLILPPINEQRRIVAKLDSLFSRSSRAREDLERIPKLIERYKQAVLEAACSGRLTADWRGQNPDVEPASELLKKIHENRKLRYIKKPSTQTVDDSSLPELPLLWSWSNLRDIGELNRGKSRHRPRNDPKLFGGKYPFIQTGDIARSNGWITKHTQTYSELGLAQSRLFPANTLCITIAANIADTAILTYPACFPDSVVGFIPEEGMFEILFAMYYLKIAQNNLETFAPATAQKNINLEILTDLAVPVPPLAEQKEIVRRVEKVFKTIDLMEQEYQKASELCGRLEQVTLSKAFRGELVPQNPDDEPASVLLERMFAEKDGHPTAKRGRTKKRS